jgi:hypothetical protein
MALAETKAKTDTKQDHPSKLGKVAFWKHHKSNAAKPVPAKSSDKSKTAKVTPAKASDKKTKLQPTKATEHKAKVAPVKETSAKKPVVKTNSSAKQSQSKTGKSAVAPAAVKKPKAQGKASEAKAEHPAS